MAALNSVNTLFFRIVFLLTISFFCFKDINVILENSYFQTFTDAMNLPSLTLSKYNAQLGLFGVLFAYLALLDFIPLLENNTMYFYSIVPVRMLLFFVFTTLSYMWESNLYLHNNSVFVYSFSEVWINFIIYSALREEKNNEVNQRSKFINEEFLTEDEPFESKKEHSEVLPVEEHSD
ncbi:hypothetical protein KAFR_0A03240 [Kazachstania africana CBS 2517]|uniref:Protein ILM1 n=1 Tax=Kazachstania africana (strain ATCC 22294 / BCRC 22015 / CBS 2517 / CECT 1963 / NBRC 1671 / NRRL Y-8276) TaxID=1071382 RepID=H2AN09_KAZAF|nr:hypothetical protein KAFR_0A03240 [Kazachstania africana CBS 2517]CCF55759.1 hypothetical protein KAFR_0A03240 [Kazachstania africana CBS 2517]